MRLVESIMTGNPCYKAGRKITVKGLMLHSVGCPQPKASVFIDSWNRADYGSACVHGFIDGETGAVYQTLPWDHRGWHCAGGAKGSGNDTHIGVEMCEPACIRYTSGSSFTCSDTRTAREVAERTYKAAVELFAMLCRRYGLDPLADGSVISHREGHVRGIASNHGDPEHLWEGLRLPYTMDGFRRAVKAAMDAGPSGAEKGIGLQASALKGLPEADVVRKVGALFTADQKRSGILASVSLAQFILESGYGKTELAQNANNCFGMKKMLSGNTWDGSTWDGMSVYTKKTLEQKADGAVYVVTADFRKYPCIEDSIADHSAYLLGARAGTAARYGGLRGCADYREAARIIKGGGYATDVSYVEKLCGIVERWKLTEYDVKVSGSSGNDTPESGDSVVDSSGGRTQASAPADEPYYRVRRTWEDVASQKGAFTALENAKRCADENPGYTVFDWEGTPVYGKAGKPGMAGAGCPFQVKVSIPDLNIRMGAGTDTGKTGRYTGAGVFTIVEVRSGEGSDAGWGRLKSGVGWIALDHALRI